jgi:hypothetical protein
MNAAVAFKRLETASPIAFPAASWRERWRYRDADGTRDLRIDMLRGLVMCVMVLVHIEIFSAFDLLAWERVGLVSGAEGFVLLSGVVLGLVHRRIILRDGWRASASKLWARAGQLYRVNVLLTGSILLLTYVPGLITSEVTTFQDLGGSVVYPLYPPHAAPWWVQVASVLTLRATPHQFQVIGLYIVLMAAGPAVMWMLSTGRVKALLAASWVLYFRYWAYPANLFDFQFEYAFPIFTWQLLFVHGLAFGYFRNEIMNWLKGGRGLALVITSTAAFVAFLVFAQTNPNPFVPAWSRLDLTEPGTFYRIYGDYFTKKLLGPGRLVNYAACLTVAYVVMTYGWTIVNRLVGWLLIPMGQASLYVFIVHVYVALLISNLPPFVGLVPAYGSGNVWLNTLAHAGAILLLWTMVRTQFLFRWIPR